MFASTHRAPDMAHSKKCTLVSDKTTVYLNTADSHHNLKLEISSERERDYDILLILTTYLLPHMQYVPCLIHSKCNGTKNPVLEFIVSCLYKHEFQGNSKKRCKLRSYKQQDWTHKYSALYKSVIQLINQGQVLHQTKSQWHTL